MRTADFCDVNGQRMRPGMQVAYVTSWAMAYPETRNDVTTIEIKHGKLTAAKIKVIEIVTDAWAEMDAMLKLHLENGDEVDPADAIVTDGKYEHVCG